MHDSLVLPEAFSRPAVSATSLYACNDAIALVAREKNVSVRMLTHRSRCRKQTALARQLAMYLAHVVLGRSLTEIGDAFGRDRTTVSHACGLIEDMRDDPAFDEEVTAFERHLEAQRDEAAGHAC